MARVVFVISVCLTATCLIVCGQVFAGKQRSISVDAQWSRWLKQEKRPEVRALWEEIQNTDLPHWQIIAPSEGTPKFFRADVVQELYNDLLAYLDEWLESRGFGAVPKIGGYSKGTLPEDPVDDFLNYVAAYDAILFPSLVHLIHIALSDESPLDEEEQMFLDYRLKWLDQVLLPAGMSIDWQAQYKTVVEEYQQEWQAATVQIPEASTLSVLKAKAAAEKPYAEFLQKNLCQMQYVEELAMKTSWNAATSLHRKCMCFADKQDPLLPAHLRFALAASIFGPYLTQEDRRLIVYWLKLSEISSSRVDALIKTSTWAREISEYQLPGAQLRAGDFKFVIKQLPRARIVRRATGIPKRGINRAGNTMHFRVKLGRPTYSTKVNPQLAPTVVSKAQSRAGKSETIPVTVAAKTLVKTVPPFGAKIQGEPIRSVSFRPQPMVESCAVPPRPLRMQRLAQQVTDNRRHAAFSFESVLDNMTGPPRPGPPQQLAQPRPYGPPYPPVVQPYPVGVRHQAASQFSHYPGPDYQPYVPQNSSSYRGTTQACPSSTPSGYVSAPYSPEPVVPPAVPVVPGFHRMESVGRVGSVEGGESVESVVSSGCVGSQVNTKESASSMFVFELYKPLPGSGRTRTGSK